MDLIFATSNTHKLEEASKILGDGFNVVSLKSLNYTEDIPETGTTLQENALQKARCVWELFHKPCFADDTGLEIDALNGEPGVYSARYAGEAHSSEANMQKVLSKLRGVSAKDRTARFKCVIAYIEEGKEALFEGVVEGEILEAKEGIGGFGYDPIFRPTGYEKSFAALSPEEKNSISHRGRALAKFVEYLKGR